MRFHCGISFSWRTIKKFLIPFLIGLFGCFGFNWIKDNIDNISLGFIPVYAEEVDDITENDIPDELNYYYDLENVEITEHKALHDKIYWFDDNTTELGVLTSIYELLFLYCITIILLKILTIIKNKRW